jgi:hypothetical protein
VTQVTHQQTCTTTASGDEKFQTGNESELLITVGGDEKIQEGGRKLVIPNTGGYKATAAAPQLSGGEDLGEPTHPSQNRLPGNIEESPERSGARARGALLTQGNDDQNDSGPVHFST